MIFTHDIFSIIALYLTEDDVWLCRRINKQVKNTIHEISWTGYSALYDDNIADIIIIKFNNYFNFYYTYYYNNMDIHYGNINDVQFNNNILKNTKSTWIINSKYDYKQWNISHSPYSELFINYQNKNQDMIYFLNNILKNDNKKYLIYK